MQILIVDVSKAMRTVMPALGAWICGPRAPLTPPATAADSTARALIERQRVGTPILAASGGVVMSVFGLEPKALLRSGDTHNPSGVRTRFETTGPSVFRKPVGDAAR